MFIYLGFVLVFLMFVVFLCFLVFMADLMFIGHDFATTKKGINKLSEILRIFNRENSIFYDFGSSRGSMAVGLSKICPGLKILGIDSSKLRTAEARFWSKMNFSKVSFVCQNIRNFDVSKADVVYIYQNQKNTDVLEEKLQHELKSGAMVITNTQSFHNWKPRQIYITYPKKPEYEKMFVYLQN